MEEIKEISQINFGVSSTEDILSKSVYEVKYSKYTEKKTNTVYDHRGGAIFNKKCETCKEYEQLCPGHFGHIKLNAVIVNPIFFNHVVNILKIVCYNCSKLLLSRKHLEFNNITKFEGERRIAEIILKVKKCIKCFHCSAEKREYKIKKDPFLNIICYNNTKTDITDEEIFKIFKDIDMETLELLKTSHPKNYCLEVFPVIPPCCRPYEFISNNIKEDDLTKQLVEIIKVNNSLLTTQDKKSAIINLKFKIETYCRNPKKVRNINSDPIKGIRERLIGKDGQLRDNLMGKRTEMSARTVIGPGVTLKLNEVGIPEFIAKTITFPINVYSTNIDTIRTMVEKGIVKKIKRNEKIIRLDLQMYSDILNFLKIGDVIVRNDERIHVTDPKIILLKTDKIFRNNVDITPEQIPEIKPLDIRVGDIAQRRILDGDWVLMNRQPTLWKGSMMAFKVVISKFGSKTFTFNLAVCKAFNADFDGDEQNAHFPQSIESSIELQLLCTPEKCLLNNSNGNPAIVILQDALLGAYLMSEESSMIVNIPTYNDIIMCLSQPFHVYFKRMEEIRSTLKKLNLYKGEHSLRTGRSILSLIIPNDFNLNYEDLKICEGVIYDGVLTKKYLGSSKTSFIFLFKMEYGLETCVNFINDIQFMTNQWLLTNSFSINISDCFQNDFTDLNIQDYLNSADYIDKTVLNKKLAEAKINVLLSNAKDIGMKIADNSQNNFVKMIKSGSKGDFFNLGQVKGLLGQQIINGKRIENQLDNCTRSLIHYKKNPTTLQEKFESRGFLMDSFFKGVNPKGFFFHGMSGRQGVCDTAMTTSTSGYITRRLVKLTEDIKIQNDGTVADTNGNIYSYVYGELGMSPENKFIDIDKIIKKLNAEYADE